MKRDVLCTNSDISSWQSSDGPDALARQVDGLVAQTAVRPHPSAAVLRPTHESDKCTRLVHNCADPIVMDRSNKRSFSSSFM